MAKTLFRFFQMVSDGIVQLFSAGFRWFQKQLFPAILTSWCRAGFFSCKKAGIEMALDGFIFWQIE